MSLGNDISVSDETRYLDWADHRLIWVNDQHIEACMQQTQNGAADGIAVSADMGYRLDDIDFLRSYPDLKGVVLPDAAGMDLSALEGLSKLEFLSVAGSSQSIDLRLYPLLQQAWLEWHDGIRLPEEGGVLRVLALHQFRPKSGDLKGLPVLPLLENLSLINSTIQSLEGLGKHRGLRRFEVSYGAKLRSLDGLLPLANQLRVLEFQRCPCIRDYQRLGQMTSLEVLLLNSCARIPSIEFVTAMRSLRELRFVGTDVVDGDMVPLMTHCTLRTITFTAKRHFSHRPREVQAELDERRSAR